MITKDSEISSYELLATGSGRRIERFGSIVTNRPESQALWKTLPVGEKIDAIFNDGEWQPPQLHWKVMLTEFGITLNLRLTPFRHVGMFPEQSVNWQWLVSLVEKTPSTRVLNLFAYTGAASIIAAKRGAIVTHVDASAPSIKWAKENAATSQLPSDSIRWIEDDALKFMRREVRRGKKYDVIMMDPPTFGRGPKGEIFRLEERIEELFLLSKQLLSGKPAGFLINAYATSLYPETVLRLANQILGGTFPHLEAETLCLSEKNNNMLLPTGFFIRS